MELKKEERTRWLERNSQEGLICAINASVAGVVASCASEIPRHRYSSSARIRESPARSATAASQMLALDLFDAEPESS